MLGYRAEFPGDAQWRSEGGQGGSCPEAPAEGGRQNSTKEFYKIYTRRNLKNSERKCSHFFFDSILDFSAPPPPPHKISKNILIY